MTALVDTGRVPEKNFPFNDFRIADLRFTAPRSRSRAECST